MSSDSHRVRRSVASALALALLCGGDRTLAKTPPSSAPSGVRAAEAEALANEAARANPSVAALRARVQALSHKVHGAGAWLDPKLALEYSNIPTDSGLLGAHPMSGLQLKLQQTFLFPGKTRLRREVARGEVAAKRLEVSERRLQLRAQVKRAFFRLALARQLRKVTGDHVKLVGQFLDVVRIKYEVGKVGQHELLRLQVLQGKLADDLESFERDDRALTAAINATLHRRAEVRVVTPARLSAAPPGAGLTAAALLERARASRPLLRWYRQRGRTRQAASRQAAREGYPDITAWIGYRVRLAAGTDPGTDFFSAGVSLPLPVFVDRRFGSRRRSQLAQARALELQRRAELERIRGDLGQALASWRRAAGQARTYRDKLVPQAQRTLDATFAAYQVGRAEFSSLFQAELQLLQFERTIRRAGARAALSRVQVEALTGAAVAPDEQRQASR